MMKFSQALAILQFGMFGAASALTINANFTASDTVPITSVGYTAAGNDIRISLGFAPTTGEALTVVKNTGTNVIDGTFSNLAQGQKLILKSGDAVYQYVANYYGGDGNDLVLTPANVVIAQWPAVVKNQTVYVPTAIDQSGVLAGKVVIAIANGTYHSLALCSDGTLAAWGTNSSGQLGNGSTVSSAVTPVLVDRSGVLAGKTVISVAAGNGYSLALCMDGSVTAWGANNYYQLGNTTPTKSTVPVMVDQSTVLAGKKVIKIAAGTSHALALCSDGTLVGWGYSYYGQLGYSLYSSTFSLPVNVNQTTDLAGKSITDLAAGENHSMVLCSDGTLATWGRNNNGQLGAGNFSNYYMAVAINGNGVLAGKTVVGIAAGANHNLAVCSDGTIAAWGDGSNNQLGVAAISRSNLPIAVAVRGSLIDKTPIAVMAGSVHSLAWCSDDTFAVWGNNSSGQFGNGSTKLSSSASPVSVTRSGVFSGRTVSAVAVSGARDMVSLSSPYWGLSSLTLSSGDLSPGFQTSEKNYTATVPNAVSSITVAPVLSDDASILTLNGTVQPSGSVPVEIPLSVGPNVITMKITSADGQSDITYTLNVMRTVTLTVSSDSYGSITGAGEYPPGTVVQVTAVPEPGYVLDGWTGDASGKTSSLTITMDGNKSLGAVFVEDLRDFDKDGLTNYMEAQRGLDPNNPDTDGDGLSDFFEIYSGFSTASMSPRIGDVVYYSYTAGKIRFLGKLPPGLTFNEETGVLVGLLSGKPETYMLTVQLLDDNGVWQTLSLSYRVAPLPSGLTGNYQALVMAGGDLPIGMINFGISEDGAYTASLLQSGSKNIRRTKGQLYLTENGDKATLMMTFPSASSLESQQVYAEITPDSALVSGGSSIGDIKGFRLATKGVLEMRDTAVNFVFDQGKQDGINTPAGIGWATGKLSSSTSSITLSGQLGDAQPFKTSLQISTTGQAILWTQPYGDSAASYLGGFVSLRDFVNGWVDESPPVSTTWGEMVWYCGYRPRSKSYPLGFGPLAVSGHVAPYTALTNAEAMATSLGILDRQMPSTIDGVGLELPEVAQSLPETFTLANDFSLVAGSSITSSPQPPWKLKLNRKNGCFSGSVKLPTYPSTDIRAGKSPVSGVFIQNGLMSPYVGAGLIQIPMKDRSGSFRTSAIRLGE